MVFVETPTFTKRVLQLLEDDEYVALQLYLAERPSAGDIIRHSGGIRKLRWRGSGRGGLRVIYYWWAKKDRITMLMLYAKNEQDDLTPDQLKQIRKAIGSE